MIMKGSALIDFSILILMLGFAATADAQPYLEWDAPTPADARITDYELHCVQQPGTLVLDGTQLTGWVPATETEIDITDVLSPGHVHDCAVLAYASGYGLRSGPSNVLSLDLTDVQTPTGLSIKIVVTVNVP